MFTHFGSDVEFVCIYAFSGYKELKVEEHSSVIFKLLNIHTAIDRLIEIAV